MFATLVSTASATGETTALITGTPEITDGDSLTIGPVRIRIYGIDAPEFSQRCATADGSDWACGVEAKQALVDLVANDMLDCVAREQDGYGRIIATCTTDGQDLSETMVRNGLAWAYREYSQEYVALEDSVRPTGIGIWQAPTEAPWDYRSDRWGRAVAASPGGCPIKGNISQTGERIYHTPWSMYYSRTQINTGSEERWFCDEAEAIAAGWRNVRN